MNQITSVDIDVSMGSSMVAIRQPGGGVIVEPPFYKCVQPDYQNRYRNSDKLIKDLEWFITGTSSSLFGKLLGSQ